MESVKHSILAGSTKYPKQEGFVPTYGTAGFRADGSLLPSTLYRCGLLMASRSMKTGLVTGIVVTASHNPENDNGVKLVDPTGEMLNQGWEQHADELAAANTDEVVYNVIEKIVHEQGVSIGPGKVFLARDTRPTGVSLLEAAVAGIEAMQVTAVDCGVLTTPQLHWMVRETNAGRPSAECDYFDNLCTSFMELLGPNCQGQEVLVVDCANGVGAEKLKEIGARLDGVISLDLRNTGEGVLNGVCGADYVQKERVLPVNFATVADGRRCASIDGDADRLVYFTNQGSSFWLLDGDKTAALIAMMLIDLVNQLPNKDDVTVGIVQTAYANGRSTSYMQRELGCCVEVTPTGVKHLHEAAHHFDVGIYFEANGHGTVLFRPEFVEILKQDSSPAARELLCLSRLINQAVGDALSILLLVEAALCRKKWGLTEWASLYEDLPSKQCKVKVADRSVIKTTDAERTVSEPQTLQQLIDLEVAKYQSGRAFVRPSGTEDIVRVYAEAASQADADALANAVAGHVFGTCGGVGEAP